MARLTSRVVGFAEAFPWVVVLGTLALSVGFGVFAQKTLVPRTDLTELLPRNSPGFRAYEHQAGRLPGSTNIAIIVESPSPEANAKFIDAVSGKIEAELSRHKDCETKCAKDAACIAACGPDLMSYVEANTKDVRKYYEDNKWLYASKQELEEIVPVGNYALQLFWFDGHQAGLYSYRYLRMLCHCAACHDGSAERPSLSRA